MDISLVNMEELILVNEKKIKILRLILKFEVKEQLIFSQMQDRKSLYYNLLKDKMEHDYNICIAAINRLWKYYDNL